MHYVQGSSKNKIAVYELNPKGKKTILFIHGWPLNHKIYEYQVNILPDLGFRTVSIDLRGFGNSDVTASGYEYEELAKDVHKVIQSLGVKNLILVGFSMGAAICIKYMNLFNEYKVSKLALLGAAAPSFIKRPDYPFGISEKEINSIIRQCYHDRPKTVADFGEKLFATNVSDEMRLWFKNINFSSSGIATIETAKSLRNEDLRNDLSNIKVPTGIFHGKKDEICPYPFAEVLHDGIKNSKLYVFENSGHALFIDELEKFNREFISFISH